MQIEQAAKILEDMGFPDGRTLKYNQEVLSMVGYVTSFLPPDTKTIQRLLCIEQGWDSIPKCEVCGNDNVFSRKKLYSQHYHGWSRCCSKECNAKSTSRLNRSKDTMKFRYGVEFSGQSPELLKKSQDTMEDRYGARHYIQSEQGMQKYKSSMIDKYGVEHSLQSKEIYTKAQESWMVRYGITSPLMFDEFKEKRTKTWEQKYNGHPMQSHITDESLNVLLDKASLENHYNLWGSSDSGSTDLGVSATTYKSYLHKHGIEILPPSVTSSYESEICRVLDGVGVHYTTSDRLILDGQECDIVVESHKLIIEFNGVYWHSDKFKHKLYHQEKTLKAHSNGYNIIHVWEDDWLNKRELIINKIKHKLNILTDSKVYARQCKVVVPKNDDVISFYNTHHIQGHINTSIIYALQYDDQIVACMSLKRTSDGGYDLTRYATSKSVVGGFTKLLKTFIKEHTPSHITTFASLDYSNGDVYLKNGFDLVGVTPPNYWYVKNGKRHNRMMFMKSKLRNKLEKFDPLISEYDNMINNGYLRLYDSGSLKFKMSL